MAGHMDKLAIVRSMHTEENNHPQGNPLRPDRPPPQSCPEVSQPGFDHLQGTGSEEQPPTLHHGPRKHQETDFFLLY